MAGMMKYYDGKERLIIDYTDEEARHKHAIVPDGAVVRVPLMLADSESAQHLLLDDENCSSETAYEDRKLSIANRWRGPANEAISSTQHGERAAPPGAEPDSAQFYAQRIAKLENAWRGSDAKSR